MSCGPDWYREDGALLQAVRASGWSPPIEPIIPGYSQWQELRRGGQGLIYSATQLSTRRRVAVKVLLGGAAASSAQRRRFEREIDLIASFQHPHIVRLYDRGATDQGLPYYVMELIDGQTLDAWLGLSSTGRSEARGGGPQPSSEIPLADPPPPSIRATLTVLHQVCEAVAFAHRHGVIHRDLKPGNILIDRAGVPHVLDFGLARSMPSGGAPATSSVSQTGEFMGTLPWASPEQAAGEPDRIDARSDVYSLGVILYQALTGRLPYPTATLPEAIESIRHVDPHPPGTIGWRGRRGRNIDARLDSIVLTCLAKNPRRRYADAGALAGDLSSYLRGEPIVARPDRPLERVVKFVRHHRAAVRRGVALVVLGGVALAIVWAWARTEHVRRFAVERRSDGLTVVDTAVLGENVPADWGAGSTLRANTLRNPPANATLTGSLDLGHTGGDSRGSLTLSTGQRLVVGEHLRVGTDAPGMLEILAGSAVQSSSGCLGYEIGSRGEVRIAGAGSTWACSSVLQVGNLGRGQLAIADGGGASASELRVGLNTYGMMIVDGSDSTFDASLVVVGETAEGVLDIRACGRVVTDATELGLRRGARGTLTIHGSGSEFDNRGDGEFVVGRAGEGLLEVDEGARVSARNYVLGWDASAVGRAVATGTGTRLHSRRMIYVGKSGHGTFELRSGALFDSAGVVAWRRGSVGSVVIAGRGTIWDAGRTWVSIGGEGTGTLSIRDGGTLMSADGAISTAGSDSGVSPDSYGEVVLSGAGSTWITRYLYVGGSKDGDGGVAELTVERGAVLAVADTLRLHPQGAVTLADGTLALDSLEIRAGGTLALNGGRCHLATVTGTLADSGAALMTLRSPGVLVVTGDFVQTAGALEIRLFGAAPGRFDRVDLSGAAKLGGDLVVRLCDGFIPAREDRIEVLTAARVEGAFANATPRCALVGGGSCEVVVAGGSVRLTDFAGPFAPEAYVEDPTIAGMPPWEPSASGPFPGLLSANTTGDSDRRFLGPPDDIHLGIGGQIVEFDFGERRVVDGPGCDLVVYEGLGGGPEFAWFDILVSADGEQFVSIKGSESPGVRIAGDELCADMRFAGGYDLARTGLAAVRYVRIDGYGEGRSGSQELFDLDAIGAVHWVRAAPALPAD